MCPNLLGLPGDPTKLHPITLPDLALETDVVPLLQMFTTLLHVHKIVRE